MFSQEDCFTGKLFHCGLFHKKTFRCRLFHQNNLHRKPFHRKTISSENLLPLSAQDPYHGNPS